MATLETGYNAAGAAQTYTTVAAAKAAGASDGSDQINCHYSDATKNRFWFESLHSSVSTQGIGIQGDSTELPNRQCVFVVPTNSAFALYSGDLSGVSTQFVVQNLSALCGERQKYFLQWNDTTGGGSGVRVTNCYISSASFGVRHTAGDNNAVQVDNCSIEGCVYGVYCDKPMLIYYNSIYASLQDGIDNANQASTITNNVILYSAAGNDFDNMTNATVTYCCDSDGSLPAAAGNITKTDPDDLDFWSDAAEDILGGTRGMMLDPRIVTTSDLYQAGTPIGGITTDCDGNSRDATNPSIGWHEGTTNPYGLTAPSTTPTFTSNITAVDRGDGTVAVSFSAGTDTDRYHVAVHTSSISSGDLDARTYDTVIVDEDGSASYTAIVGTTAGGGALLADGTTYYFAVAAWNQGSRDAGSDNASTTVTDPLAAGGVPYVLRSITSVQLGTSATTIYTCPSGKRAVIRLALANTDTSVRTATVYLVNSGDAAADDVAQAKTYSLDAIATTTGSSEAYWGPFTLEAGDVLSGLASVASKVTATIQSCVEQTL